MRRFFVPPQIWSEKVIGLDRDLLRHLSVLRLKVGDEVLLLDGLGQVARCRLETLGRNQGQAIVVDRWSETESALPLQLMQGVPKGDKLDLVLQKGTELGITRFSPVFTERSQASRFKSGRLERWHRIVSEAARQSRRPLIPRLDEPAALGEALSCCTAELKLLIWEEGSRALREAVAERRPFSAAILIGPEGGLSAGEAEEAQKAGFVPVHLGTRIMRSETAPLAVASVLQYLYGDWDIAPSG